MKTGNLFSLALGVVTLASSGIAWEKADDLKENGNKKSSKKLRIASAITLGIGTSLLAAAAIEDEK